MQTPHTAEKRPDGIPKMVSPRELSELIGINVHTLANWRSKGQGPRSFRLCGSVKYVLQDVAAWIKHQQQVDERFQPSAADTELR